MPRLGLVPAYEDAFEAAGIPYLTVAGGGFYGRPEIRDLLNALRALADPTDDLAMAGLLRSPAFALSDAALYLLAVDIREEFPAREADCQGEGDCLRQVVGRPTAIRRDSAR